MELNKKKEKKKGNKPKPNPKAIHGTSFVGDDQVRTHI